MHIRPATLADTENIQQIHQEAFPASEADIIANLAIALLPESPTSAILSLVVEREGQPIAHAVFSPVQLASEKPGQGYILAPLAVLPSHQRTGVGTTLVKAGLEQLTQQGVKLVFVYGDPDYYGRFGFQAAIATQYSAPYPLEYPFGWQAIALVDGVEPPASPTTITCVPPLCDATLW